MFDPMFDPSSAGVASGGESQGQRRTRLGLWYQPDRWGGVGLSGPDRAERVPAFRPSHPDPIQETLDNFRVELISEMTRLRGDSNSRLEAGLRQLQATLLSFMQVRRTQTRSRGGGSAMSTTDFKCRSCHRSLRGKAGRRPQGPPPHPSLPTPTKPA